MQIPIYLAVKSEEIQKFPLAQLGFGFYPNGNVRLPSRMMSRAVAVVDDLYLPKFTQSAIEILKAKIPNGCILDFERSPTALHEKLISSLPRIIALPAKFHKHAPKALPIVSCPDPCNQWKRFLQETQRQHPRGWMLEITPWCRKVNGTAPAKEGVLQNALCRYRFENDELLYFDTRQTIAQKVTMAQSFGCKAAIALLDEVKKLL